MNRLQVDLFGSPMGNRPGVRGIHLPLLLLLLLYHLSMRSHGEANIEGQECSEVPRMELDKEIAL